MDRNPQLRPPSSDGIGTFRLDPHEHGICEQSALGRWLETFRWESWGTFTFDARFGLDGPSLERAGYHFRGWLNAHSHRPGAFYAVERGSGSGRAHVHALIGPGSRGLGPAVEPLRRELWGAWFNRFGRAEILPYGKDRRGRDVSGAEFYLTKYLTKAPLHWGIEGRIFPA